jgi:hypothetical protein
VAGDVRKRPDQRRQIRIAQKILDDDELERLAMQRRVPQSGKVQEGHWRDIIAVLPADAIPSCDGAIIDN